MADDDFSLHPDTLAALHEFLAERKKAEERAEREAQELDTAVLATPEDWQLSQFWYDEDTAIFLAKELIAAAAEFGPGARVACISCPSVYKALISEAVGVPDWLAGQVSILEYDRRFGVFGDAFGFYDFNKPAEFPAHLAKACDVIILDPPFINRECLENFAHTVGLMKRNASTRVLLCTGSVQVPYARKFLSLRPTKKHVGHSNRLSNPFSLYANYPESVCNARLEGYDVDAEAAAGVEGAPEGMAVPIPLGSIVIDQSQSKAWGGGAAQASAAGSSAAVSGSEQ